MKRIWMILLLIVGCATSSAPPQYTLRHPDMNYLEFLSRADAKVAGKFPQWYVKDISRELDFEEQNGMFASVEKQEDGTFVMYIYEGSWDLCTVEDLALVLLHEYVHAKIWDSLEEMPNELCREVIHELTAYGVELNQTKIKGTSAMRYGTRLGYDYNYALAQSYCSEELIKDFPKPEAH